MLSEEQQKEVIDRMVNVYLELGRCLLNNKAGASELDAFVKMSGIMVPIIAATL